MAHTERVFGYVVHVCAYNGWQTNCGDGGIVGSIATHVHIVLIEVVLTILFMSFQ